MDLGIANKIALVSGGSKGMGRAVAEQLASEGAKVLIVAREQAAIDETVKTILSAGGQASGISADLFSEAGVERAVQYCEKVFNGKPDIAVANVYGTDRHTFETADSEIFRAGYEQIVMSTTFLARAVLPAMKDKGWGRIITIGSFAAKKPHWHIPLIVDNVTRAAALALSKSLSNEYGRFGITVNTVAPGFIATDMANGWLRQMAVEQGKDPDEDARERNAGIPVGRLGEPREFAAVCAFLCSEPASYITGQLLMVDGGLVGTPF